MNYYMLVGQWGYDQNVPMGICTYRYFPENGALEMIDTVRPDIVSGQMCIDQERGIAYIVDEIGHIRGDLGGGGYVNAFHIDKKTGKLEFINEQRSLSPEPCYLFLDPSKKFLLASHTSDPYHVTKIRRLEDGSFTSDTVYDDTALVLFRINDDGSIGPVCDVAVTKGCGATGPDSRSYVHPVSGHIMHIRVISRQHSVAGNPDGSLYAVCDRGMDKIYTFHLDHDKGRLTQLREYTEGVASSPRYCRFHPTKPYFYANMEKIPYVYAYRYNAEDGSLEKICETQTVFDRSKVISGCSDLHMDPSGRHLYSTSNPDTISVMDIMDDGSLKLKQNVSCGGDYPRAICLSPDGKYLFSGNNHSATITSFSVNDDGTLSPTGMEIKSIQPSVIRFYTAG